MKKTIILIALTLGISANALAQREQQPEKKFHYGNKIGINLSTLPSFAWENSENQSGTAKGSMVVGLHVGAYFNYAFNGFWGIQSEILYSRQGGRVANHTLFYDCINLPLLIDIKPIKNVPFSILAGVQWGIRMADWENNGGVINRGVSTSRWNWGVSEALAGDFSAAVGVQYTFKRHLMLGLRYNVDLVPNKALYTSYVIDEAGDEIYRPTFYKGARNHVVQVSVGWTF